MTASLDEPRLRVRERGQGCVVALALPDLLPLGGAERTTLRVAEVLVEAGYQVDLVLAMDSQDPALVVPRAVRVVEFKRKSLRAFIGPFVQYLRTEQPSVVIASMWPFTSLCVLANTLARSRAKVVVIEHGILSVQFAQRGLGFRTALRGSLAFTHRIADARIAVSKGSADDLAALAWLDASQVSVQYNPLAVAAGRGTGEALAEQAWSGYEGKRILTVGRFKPAKNHELLIRAFAQLSQDIEAKLMILGTGPLRERIAEFVRRQGLEHRVILPGHVLDVAPFYAAADLFVLSSDYEGFGNVIVEALSFGLPVVSTDCPHGPAEILNHGRYGTLVPLGDAKALATAIADALARPHDTEALVQRAKDFAPEKSNVLTQGLLKYVQSVASTSTSGADG